VERLDAGLGRVAFFVVPSSIAFLLAGDLIVATVFQWRAFSPRASVQVGIILAVYALGMLASTSSRLLQSALYGAGDARTPAIYAVMRVVVSLAIGISIMFPLDAFGVGPEGGVALVGDPAWSPAPEALRSAPESAFRLGAAGLAFGAAVGAWFELWLLRIRVGIVFGPTRLGGPHARAIGLAALAGVVGAGVARVVVDATGVGLRLGGILAILVIGGAYLVTARALGVPEAAELTGRAERLLRRR
jgi:putative peptidoglycan lipid II flippase